MALEIPKVLSSETSHRVKQGEIPNTKVDSYFKLLARIDKEILPHQVIVDNAYPRWFKEAALSKEEVRHFIVQFSVFSNLFIEAQLKKVINAPTLEAMRASKEILMNELGVVFRNPNRSKGTENAEVEPDLVGTAGTIEGGTFRFAAAHFEWLLRMLPHLGLEFRDIGKRRVGTKSTVFFCDELARLYGSDDAHIGLGASFAVENWAAAGFWKELISGLEKFKKKSAPELPIAFFKWHDQVEDQHKEHTWAELEEEYFAIDLNEDKFIQGGKDMLGGVLAFWDGLNQDRLRRG